MREIDTNLAENGPKLNALKAPVAASCRERCIARSFLNAKKRITSSGATPLCFRFPKPAGKANKNSPKFSNLNVMLQVAPIPQNHKSLTTNFAHGKPLLYKMKFGISACFWRWPSTAQDSLLQFQLQQQIHQTIPTPSPSSSSSSSCSCASSSSSPNPNSSARSALVTAHDNLLTGRGFKFHWRHMGAGI